jgi:hypothetical protein
VRHRQTHEDISIDILATTCCRAFTSKQEQTHAQSRVKNTQKVPFQKKFDGEEVTILGRLLGKDRREGGTFPKEI